MSALEHIAFFQNRRDEVPNQELARRLAAERDAQGIREIAGGLHHKNANVRSDCIKVLYEISYIDPALVEEHTTEFLQLLHSRENRLVWGALIALAAVAPRRPELAAAELDTLLRVTAGGTVISVVWGVRTLAGLAAALPELRPRILPALFRILRTTIPRDVPTHAASMLCAVDAACRAEFLEILEARRPEMTPAQAARLKKVIRQLDG